MKAGTEISFRSTEGFMVFFFAVALASCGDKDNGSGDGEVDDAVSDPGDADTAETDGTDGSDQDAADQADGDPGDGSEDPAGDPSEEELPPREYTLYFGDMHGHTELSEAEGTPEEFFTYARDVSMLDFCAITDHDLDADRLATAVSVANDFNSDTFVTFHGSEWSDCDYGHIPCYNIVNACEPGMDSCDTPEELHASVEADGGLCHGAHPARDGCNAVWSAIDPDVEVSGEIYYDEAAMNEAWDMGLKLGVVGVSDTHSCGPGSEGVTGCYATGLTRDEILEAVRAHRCFATNDESNPASNPMDLSFKMNGRWMGETLTVADGSTLTFEIVINATNDVDTVYLKTSGGAVADEYACNDTRCEWTGSFNAAGSAYYYVNATAADGEEIWSSPVWIEIGD